MTSVIKFGVPTPCLLAGPGHEERLKPRIERSASGSLTDEEIASAKQFRKNALKGEGISPVTACTAL